MSNLSDLTRKLASNPEVIHELDDETLDQAVRILNPLGSVITDTREQYANLSITNYRDKYHRNMTVTALIAYLHRLVEEYEPENRLEAMRLEYRDLMTKFPENYKELHAEMELACKRMTNATKMILREFLARHFEYNPERHVRTAHTENKADVSRETKYKKIAEQVFVKERASATEAKLRSNPESSFTYSRNTILAAYQASCDNLEIVGQCLSSILDTEISLEDKQAILLRQYSQLKQLVDRIEPIAKPLQKIDTLIALEKAPPIDLFYHFDRFFSNHYEELRDICNVVYNEKPDIEFECTFYASFDNENSAKIHRQQYESEFRKEVHTISNRGTTLMGPFKANRDKLDYYNKNTEILKAMSEGNETDAKLGKDIYEKRLKVEKAKNIREHGADAKGLKTYAATAAGTNTGVQEAGIKPTLTSDQKEELELANVKTNIVELENVSSKVQDEDHDDCPADAIEMNYFYPHTNANGDIDELKMGVMYSQAEEPLHLQPNSEYHDKYQPIRSKCIRESYKKENVIDEHGRVSTIHAPIQ